MNTLANSDVSGHAQALRCPVLVVHSRGDVRNPFEEGRRLAGLIPGARFVPAESGNYIVFPSEPAYPEIVRQVREFLAEDGASAAQVQDAFNDLTPRERDVLELIARGLDNLQIAAHLGVSEKTVRNHITPIFDKLAVENRSQAIVKAREAGLGTARRPI
jgi:DNA-binding NarL/FixJ family response regulator